MTGSTLSTHGEDYGTKAGGRQGKTVSTCDLMCLGFCRTQRGCGDSRGGRLDGGKAASLPQRKQYPPLRTPDIGRVTSEEQGSLEMGTGICQEREKLVLQHSTLGS